MLDKKIETANYFVQGMHCAACELTIETRLLAIDGVESVEASTAKGEVFIAYEKEKPTIELLNKTFQENGYIFSEKPLKEKENIERVDGWLVFSISLFVIFVFYLLQKTGLVSLISVNSQSSLPAFFLFGALAGVSSCAALVGGLVLSLSKQWAELYSDSHSFWQKSQPHLLFNIGRLVSFLMLGGVLGFIGKKLQFSLTASSILVLAVSILMMVLALQMLGVKAFQKFQISVPKFLTKKIADESNFRRKFMPLVLGALTFFLPCGFTLTAQAAALISGSALNGSLIMFLFALGTSPALLAIGVTSVKLIKGHRFSASFLKIAGVLILFFALFNINFQLNVLGISSLSDLGINSGRSSSAAKNDSFQNEEGMPPIVNGKQILKMDASSRGYLPNYFKVKAGMPVRWEIKDNGTSGCTNAIISKSLFEGKIPLTLGQISIKEFTPETPGKYKFSCWMGMISGIIEVIDKSNPTAQNNSLNSNESSFTPSDAEQSGGKCSVGEGYSCGR